MRLYFIVMVTLITMSASARAEDMCSHYEPIRTKKVTLDNQTPFGVKIWFVQVLDTKGNRPNGDFLTDSGVIIGATDGNGPATFSIDPCHAGGFQKPIQGDTCTGTVKLIGDTEIDIKLPDDKSGPAPYLNDCGWVLTVDDNGNVSGHPD